MAKEKDIENLELGDYQKIIQAYELNDEGFKSAKNHGWFSQCRVDHGRIA